VLRPDETSNELTLVATHPGVGVDDVRARTGWELHVSGDLAVTDPPSDDELAILRDLKARTEAAHSG
jgi:acyl CoA:acetate/3-ketoacid CoA transferase beta subunit